MTYALRFHAGIVLALALGMSPARGADSAMPVKTPHDPFAPSSTGIAQIREIMARMAKTLGSIPPDIDRIALYQIKTDPREFSAGMSRFIQAQVEQTLREQGRKTVVTSPELKTYRVVATDSSFRFSNSVPSMEELWRLGEKLRVDAFLEGSCTKSGDNDVLMNLKLFRHKTGEILWSGSFVAGPNEKQPDIFELDWSLSANMRPFPIKRGVFLVENPLDSTALGLDTLSTLTLSTYGFEAILSEAINPEKWLLFSVSVGYSFSSLAGVPDSLDMALNIQTMKFGIEVLGVFFRKANPDLGYWLGTYAGYQEFIPFLNKGHLTALTLGYRSRLSRHFSLGGGLLFLPFGRKLAGTGDESERLITFDPVAYEINFLHYTF